MPFGIPIFEHLDGETLRRTLLSLFAPRVFHNSFAIKRFHTLSQKCRVSPPPDHPFLKYYFNSSEGFVFRSARECGRAIRYLQLPVTSHKSPVTASCYNLPPMARQRLGQHFLSDLHWREEIARAIRVSPHSTAPLPQDDKHCWIEIGSGHGEMTAHLVAAGDPVHAIELDPSLIAGLRRLANNHPNLNVIPGDILEADLAAIASGRRIRVYGNLPYFITSPILQHLFTFADLIDEIHVVIQSEVAARLAAQPGTRDYGYLSVLTQLYARPEFVFALPRDAFSPPPEVTSALVTLRFPGERAKLRLADESRFLDFVKLCFSQKRKTLVNNLRSLAKPAAIREILASLHLRPDSRAEQLSLSQFAALLRHLSQD